MVVKEQASKSEIKLNNIYQNPLCKNNLLKTSFL